MAITERRIQKAKVYLREKKAKFLFLDQEESIIFDLFVSEYIEYAILDKLQEIFLRKIDVNFNEVMSKLRLEVKRG